MKTAARVKPRESYHHGDLGPALRDAARAIIEEEGLAALSLRAVAKRAGVSHAAPYRHYASLEALLADVATRGLEELRDVLRHAGAGPGGTASSGGAVGQQIRSDKIGRIAAAYVRFATEHEGLLRLMLGTQFPNREGLAELQSAADAIGEEIGAALGDPAVGLGVWATAHGLAMLMLENVIDLGQRTAGLHVLPTRAEMLLRALFAERE